MKEPVLSIEIGRVKVREILTKRILEYQSDLCEEGMNSQQYNILRGRIKELQALFSALALD